MKPWAESIWGILIGGLDWVVGYTAKKWSREEEPSKPKQSTTDKNMAGKAGGLKGVALIGGSANSTVAGVIHFFEDPSTSSRSLELSLSVFPMFIRIPTLPLARSPVAARVHRGEGQGHGLDSGKAWIPHPRLRRHYQWLQLNRFAAFFVYHGCLFCDFCCRNGNTTTYNSESQLY